MKNFRIFYKNNKVLFYVPTIAIIVLFVFLLIFTSGTAVDPFVYAIF